SWLRLLLCLFFFSCFLYLRDLPSFPTRRSSDLFLAGQVKKLGVEIRLGVEAGAAAVLAERPDAVVIATGSHPYVPSVPGADGKRSEEHTSELQSRFDLVCRLLLEKKKTNNTRST